MANAGALASVYGRSLALSTTAAGETEILAQGAEMAFDPAAEFVT